MERALWGALARRGAALSARLARGSSDLELRRRFSEKESSQRRQAELIRRLLLNGEEKVIPG